MQFNSFKVLMQLLRDRTAFLLLQDAAAIGLSVHQEMRKIETLRRSHSQNIKRQSRSYQLSAISYQLLATIKWGFRPQLIASQNRCGGTMRP